MTRKRRTWRWVSRDANDPCLYVWSGKKKPQNNCGVWQSEDGTYVHVCGGEFKKLTGITIPEGECLKVEFTARVV